jgi:uncharacterized membrane protein
MATIEERLTAAGQDVSQLTGGETAPAPSASVNVGQYERWASAVGGGALALYGITRGSLGGIALALVGAALVQRGVTGHCNLYEAMNFNSAAGESLRNSENVSVQGERGTKVEHSIRINRAPAELYGFWRNFENLPRFMNHLESVTRFGGNRSHWVAKAPGGTTVEWDAEVYNEKEGEMIAWRTLEGSQVASAGSVHFEPAGEGATNVRVSLKYDPPGGKLGSLVARLFGENPQRQIEEDLARFKEIMEGSMGALAGGDQSSGASAGR